MADAKRTCPAKRHTQTLPVRSVWRGANALVATLAALAVTAPAVAQEQSTAVNEVTVAVDLTDANIDANDQIYTVNLEDCRNLADDPGDEIRFTWRFRSSAPSGTEYTVKIENGSETCDTSTLSSPDTDQCEVAYLRQTFSGTSLGFNLTWEQVTGVTSSASCATQNDSHFVSLIFDDYTSTDETDDVALDQVRFTFSTSRPIAPSDVEARGGESTIRVDWSAVTDADSYDVFYSTDTLTAGTAPEDLVSSFRNTTTDSVTLDDSIQANVTYYIAVSTLDEDGNASVLSEVVTVTTQPVTDFYEYYRQQGGGDAGCASVSAPATPWLGALAALLALGALARRRRGRRALLALLALSTAGLAVAPDAAAQELQSPISGEFELKLGDYEPQIDDEFSGAGPWETVFGVGGALYLEGEYSHYLWREYGAVGITFALGYLSESGNGINDDGSESVDETTFQMVPVRLGVVYRFDMPTREWSVPLVPYVKAGLDAYIWWIRSAAGISTYRDPATGELDEGRGVTFGWHVAAGVQFLLDVLAPSMSRTFDANAGVNNTYLFAEFLYADVDDFGSDTSMRLGDATFLFGLAFEF